MTTTDATTDRRTADELEIRNVIARLAHLADEGDLGEYLTLFTEDAVWQMPTNPVLGLEARRHQGHAAILAGAQERRASGLQGPGTHTRHVITTLWVEFPDGDPDRALAHAYWHFIVDTDSEPRMRGTGRYYNEMRRTPAGWKLARRDIVPG